MKFFNVVAFTVLFVCFNSVAAFAQSEDCNNQLHFSDVVDSLVCEEDPGCNEEATQSQYMVNGFDLNCQRCIECQMPTFETIDDITTGVDNFTSSQGFFNNTINKGEIDAGTNLINANNPNFNMDNDVVTGLINNADQAIDLEILFGCLNIDCLMLSIIDSILLHNTDPAYLDAIEYLENHSADSLVRAFFGVSSSKPPCSTFISSRSGNTPEQSEFDIFVEQSNIFEGLNIKNPTAANFFNSSAISSGVNEYNGMAQSSVSIYDYVNRDINVPISVSHQGSGIKVNDYSGSVGQNWDLSSVASITRKLNGLPDEYHGTNNGLGFTTIQKLGFCATFGGVSISTFKVDIIDYTPFRPNELNINISIPLGPWPFFLVFTLQLKFDLVALPGRVNLAEKGVGYLHLQDQAIMSAFNIPHDSVALQDIVGPNPGWNDEEISEFLEKASDDKERNDRRFLNPYLDRYISLWQGFLNLFSEETIETQKIDTEPDEFYINLPGYSGKFMFTQEGEIITFPHADFIIDKEIINSVNGIQIKSFTVHMTDGKSYYFGDQAIDEIRTATYVLPNIFAYYPLGGPTDTEFGPADLDESDTPRYNPYLCLPQYRENKKSYENDNVLMDGIKYISRWHLYKIESRLTGANVYISYLPSQELTYYSNQSFFAQFPNLAILGGAAFKSAQTSLLKNPNNPNSLIYQDGQSKLDYIVNQNFIQKSRISGISGEGNPDRIEFYYDTPHPEIYNDKLLSHIVLYKGAIDTSNQFKKWRFNYTDLSCDTIGDIQCTGSEVSTINFEVPGEWEFQLNDQQSKSLFRYYLKHIGIGIGPVQTSLEFTLPFISYYRGNRNNITVLKERASVLQIKSYFGKLDIDLESHIWRSEFNRAFLESIDEISYDDEEIENLVQIEYSGDICLLPKKLSLAQDQWGYYNGAVNNSPIPNIKYKDYNNTELDQRIQPFVGRHIGLVIDQGVPLNLQDNGANIDFSMNGSLKSVTYKTGLKHTFSYELNTSGAGLRVWKLEINPGTGPSKVSEFQYKNPSIIANPAFVSQNSVNKTFFGNEDYIQVQSNSFVELQNNKNNIVGYGVVIENIEGNGSIFNRYFNSNSAITRFPESGFTRTMRSIASTNVNTVSNFEGSDPFAPAVVKDWILGLPVETQMFDDSGQLKYHKKYSYRSSPAYYCRTDVLPTRLILIKNDSTLTGNRDTDTTGMHILEEDQPERCGAIGTQTVYSLKKSYFQNFIPAPWADIQGMRTIISVMPFKSGSVYAYFFNFISQNLNNINNLLNRRVLKHQIYTGLEYTSEQFVLQGDTTIVFFDDGQSNTSISYTDFYKGLSTKIHADYYNVETKQRPIYDLPGRISTSYNNNALVSSTYFYPFEITAGQYALVKFNDNPALDNVFKNSCINTPLRVEEYLNGTMVGGKLSKYVFFKGTNNTGHLRKAVSYAFAGEAFVPVSAYDDWDARGNPRYVQQTNIVTENFDSNNKGIIELEWHEDYDILLEKKYTGPENFTDTYVYNDFLQLVSQTDIDGIVNTYEYDGFGRVKKAVLQNGLQEDNYQYTFNPTTKRILTNFPDGGGTQRVRIEYNGLGQMLKTGRITILAATFEENEYDNMFRVKTQSVMGRGTIENTYQPSPLERLAETVDSEGNLTKYRYVGGSGYTQIDGAEKAVEVTDPNGHKYVDIMDALSRKVGSISGEGGVTRFQYDSRGRIMKIINPISEEYLYTYNNLGLLSQKKVPGSAPEEYYYDEFRMPLLTHDGNGNYFSKERDHYFRETNTYWADAALSPVMNGTLDFVTNAQDLYTASEVVNAVTYISGTNRVHSTTETLFGPVDNTLEKASTFTYDNFGRVSEEDIVYPEGITVKNAHTYTAGHILRDLDKEINGYTYTLSNSFDIINRPLDFTFSTQDSFTRKLSSVKYDSEDRVSSKELFGISAPLQTVDYGYDAIGRLITINSPFTTECEVPDHYGKEICFFEIRYETKNYPTVDGSLATFPCYEIDRINIDGVEYPLPNPVNMTSPDFDARLESFIRSLNLEGNVVLEMEYIPVPGPGGSVSFDPNGAKQFVLKIFDADFESITLLSVLYPGNIHCSHTLSLLNCCPAEDPEEEDPDPQDPDPENENDDLFFETVIYNGLDIRQIDMGNGCNLGIIQNQYRYDADHRLRSVKNFMLFESETQENNYNARYVYDAAGNITSLKRRGFLERDEITGEMFYGEVDDLSYTYGSNSSRLTGVQEALLPELGVKFGNYSFGYDGKGNALSMMGSAIAYNPINLPKTIASSTGEEKIWYTINGEKFKILTEAEIIDEEMDTTTEIRTRYLVQGFELAAGGAVHSFHFDDGRILLPGEDSLAAPRVQFHLKDHLGNVMVIFEDTDDDNEIEVEDTEEPNEIIERFMYYSFGMQWEGAWIYDEPVDSEENRYRYNSKEYSKGSRLYDYGARYYAADIGRWAQVDPLAEAMSPWSPYNYGFNAPIRFIDPDGKKPTDIIVEGQKWKPGMTGEGSSAFVQQTFAALNQIHSSGNSEVKGMLENFANNSDYNITIAESANTVAGITTGQISGEPFFISNQTIEFNPNLGVINKETSESFSPDVGLLHEFGHMENARSDINGFLGRKSTPDTNWSNKEEKYNIEKWEQPYAKDRGMLQRQSYSDKLTTFRTKNSTSNEKNK